MNRLGSVVTLNLYCVENLLFFEGSVIGVCCS